MELQLVVVMGMTKDLLMVLVLEMRKGELLGSHWVFEMEIE